MLHGEKGTIEVAVTMTAGAEVHVAGQEGQFAVAPVPDRFRGTTDRSKPLMQQIAHLFSTEPIGDRLFIDAPRSAPMPKGAVFAWWSAESRREV